jgi:hypothetical protein
VGLTIAAVDSQGTIARRIDDSAGILTQLLPAEDDRSYCLLRYIDRYGDTVFNQLQLDDFLEEWGRLRPEAKTVEGVALIDAVETLARECQGGVHRYLKFLGD